MRLAFISIMSRSPWAASEILWAQTALLALQQGHDVFISVYRWDTIPETIRQLADAGAHIDFRPRDHWSRRIALVSRLRRTYGPLARFAPEAICVSQGGTYDIARSGNISQLRDTLLRMRAPYLLLCHCEQAAPVGRRLRRARTAFANAAIVGVLAERLHRLSERHLDMPLPQARVFYNPVNLRRIECLPWPDDRLLRLAFVGRLDPVKNLRLLAEVLATPLWLRRDWSLTVCGVGPERQIVEHNAALRGRVQFAGYVSDIASMWTDHHVLVMPSQFEGMPLAMVEAMLCGRPVVATDVGGISEWLQDGRNGFLIAQPTTAGVGAALERMWQQRQQLASMGIQAHEDAAAKRDPDPPGTLLRWLEQTVQPSQAQGQVTAQPVTSTRLAHNRSETG